MTMSGEDKPEFIEPPTTVRDKVSVTPNGIDLDTLRQAEQLIADMADDYLKWVEGDLHRLQDLYDRAEAAPRDARRPLLDEIFSIAHDVKGQGGSFNYHLMTAIGNQLCRCIERLPEEVGAGHLAVVKVHIDALRMVIAQRLSGDGGEEGKELLAGLAAAVDKAIPRKD